MSTNTTIPNNHNTRIPSPHPTAAAMNQHNNPKTTQDTATILQNQIQQLKQQAENLETTAAKLREIANILELQRKEFVMNHSQQQQQQQASSSFSNSITNTTTEEAPLDEHGNPKYKGKKRGRKPKKRKRCLTKKRGHTAYTLFVQEAYPKVKEEYTSQPELKFQSKNIINIIAQRWKEISPEEKLEWKQRAQTLSELELEMEARDEKQCDATEGDLNHDNVIQEDHVTHDNSMLLVGESHPPNSIHNLHPVPVVPALEIGNHTNVENVHQFAPIDIGIQLQMQMTNALDHTTIMNDSVADNHERLQDIHATGMIQDPHVFRF